MSIEITDKTQAIYYCEMGGPLPFGNFLGAIAWDGEEAVFTCRFRFYQDDKNFNSADTKRWFTITGKDLEKMKERAESFCSKLTSVGTWVLHRKDRSPEEMAQQLMLAPFSHTQHSTDSIN